MNKVLMAGLVVAASAALAGCAGSGTYGQANGSKVITGPAVSDNPSPYTIALMCTSMTAQTGETVRMSVGQFPDLTGKFSNYDGGYKLTQGAQQMVQTALGRFDQVETVERIDPGVFQFEMELANSKLLGDGKITNIGGTKVNYRPLLSGSVLGSQYFVTGAITELNYNIFSGGAYIGIDSIGVGRRQYVLSVAVDMRIVETQTLRVVGSTTLQKQVVGYETKADVFRFANGDNIFINFDAGSKGQEPIQLAVRSVIEAGLANLMGELLVAEADACTRFAESEYYNNDVVTRSAMMAAPDAYAQTYAARIMNGEVPPSDFDWTDGYLNALDKLSRVRKSVELKQTGGSSQ